MSLHEGQEFENLLGAIAEIAKLRDRLSNLSNAAAIVFSHFEPKDGPGETAKALLRMELGLKLGN